MASHFPDAFAALKQAAEGLITVNQSVIRAAEAVLAAKDEHEDLKEMVERLESTVLTLVQEVRDLREGKAVTPPLHFSRP